MSLNTVISRATKLFAAAAVVLGLSVGSASATTFNAGTLGATPYSNFQTMSTGPFTDTYNFTVGALPTIISSSVSLELSFPGSPLNIFHITGLAMNLFTAGDSFISGTSGSPSSLTATLSPGNYYMKLTGTADGVSGGAYSFAIAAIPEPGQWLMLLAGIAMLGMMVRRRAG